MNKDWHSKNKMPPKATLEQRIEWHREHQAPKSLLPRMKQKK